MTLLVIDDTRPVLADIVTAKRSFSIPESAILPLKVCTLEITLAEEEAFILWVRINLSSI